MLGNIHGIAVGVVSFVNPQVPVSVQFSTGVAATAADGTLVPGYSAPVTVQAQVQDFSTRDLRQVDGLNLSGTYRSVYFFGDVEVVVRFAKFGGDLVTFPNPVGRIPAGSVWLTVIQTEAWAQGWCKCVIVLQDGS